MEERREGGEVLGQRDDFNVIFGDFFFFLVYWGHIFIS